MNVLVTGYRGYIGSVLVPMLQAESHEVVGLDNDLCATKTLGPPPPEIPALIFDVRCVTSADLHGFDAVIHLAGLSNDPLGDLNPDCTYEINHRAAVRLARLARDAGVRRFLFASSCSSYGAAGDSGLLDESASFNPVTPYAESKVNVEAEVSQLADEQFSPCYLRCATAYGYSPRLRADLVVNNLVGYAFLQGEVLLKSDGTPWRPLVHVEDIARAYRTLLAADRERVHNLAFNVGRSGENYQIRQVAEMVQQVVPGSVIRLAQQAGPDARCYQVDCRRLAQSFPEFDPQWTVRQGIEQLYQAYQEYGLTQEQFLGPEFMRIQCVKMLQQEGRLDSNLRWTEAAALHDVRA